MEASVDPEVGQAAHRVWHLQLPEQVHQLVAYPLARDGGQRPLHHRDPRGPLGVVGHPEPQAELEADGAQEAGRVVEEAALDRSTRIRRSSRSAGPP